MISNQEKCIDSFSGCPISGHDFKFHFEYDKAPPKKKIGEMKPAVIELLKAGREPADIMKITGCKYSYFCQIRRTLNGKKNRGKVPKKTPLIKKLISEGKDKDFIIEKTGCSTSHYWYVHRTIKGYYRNFTDRKPMIIL